MKKQKNLKKLKGTFYLLIVFFILVVFNLFFLGMEVEGIWRSMVISLTFSSWILFFLLGIILIFFTLKLKIKGKLKFFLFLTGFSATGFL